MKLGLLIFLLALGINAFAKEYSVTSPDGKIKVTVSVDTQIKWSATVGNQSVFTNNTMSVDLGTTVLGVNPKVVKSKTTSVSNTVQTVVAVKSKTIDNIYNQLNLVFKPNYAVSFRVFDNGIAYRFETSLKDEITVKNEEVNLNFSGDYGVLFPEEETLYSHYERLYLDQKLSSLNAGRFCSLPTLVKADNNIKIGITEADLFDYPCLFMEATGKTAFKSKYPHVILKSNPKGDREIQDIEETGYIAKTSGTRTFPWRVFMISTEDARLVENQMVFLLSRENKLTETNWIKPGLVAWDWWNENNIYGVDFKAGLDTKTYKYYIDFASKNNIPYIILDEGWTKSTTNIKEANPDLDIKELISYGKSKNVDIILWCLWNPLDAEMDAILDIYAGWGVKGIKVDFMARSEQYMVNFYERTAKACADRKLMVDFHGAFKPSGMARAYPNIINHEGVKGMENCKWGKDITPEHDVTLCFTRMLAGPLDFTPGAMTNKNEKDFAVSFSNPMSQGTRCHQIAMYVCYDAPLQMMCDSPTNYYKEQESVSFISQMPTVWDDTKVLDAKVGDYILMARQKDNNWYLGAMTDWTARSLNIDFSFLGEGTYEIEIMQDGINAEKSGNDYKRIVKQVTKAAKMKIDLAKGGGWAAICKKI
ncbi:MAG TPA: glycoside hydrolase family 97 protein [Prolixibacteraceae bacterium]|nr:glycoside hydrolase family 97 protein [Prolixibacteraceae bacterium]